jgi:hypothetical protein
MWIKVFPDKSVTARAEESRMGSGKGAVEYWVVVVKPGNILFEVSGVTKEIAMEALKIVPSGWESNAASNSEFVWFVIGAALKPVIDEEID